MTKSKTQPLCLWCGKRIAKNTSWERFGTTMGKFPDIKPKTREEAQRYVNHAIVSLSWSYHWDRDAYPPKRLSRNYIEKVGTWDGESYVDLFFCNGNHARNFAYAAARKGLAMPAYNEAIKKRDDPST